MALLVETPSEKTTSANVWPAFGTKFGLLLQSLDFSSRLFYEALESCEGELGWMPVNAEKVRNKAATSMT